jgi:outer membrane immunogenic protein
VLPSVHLYFPFSFASTFGHSQVNAGWTAGAGLEGALWGNWTWKAEYLRLDLGSVDEQHAAASPTPTGPIACGVCTTSIASLGQPNTHTRFTDNIVRVGLNYKFGNYYAPVVTK